LDVPLIVHPPPSPHGPAITSVFFSLPVANVPPPCAKNPPFFFRPPAKVAAPEGVAEISSFFPISQFDLCFPPGFAPLEEWAPFPRKTAPSYSPFSLVASVDLYPIEHWFFLVSPPPPFHPFGIFVLGISFPVEQLLKYVVSVLLPPFPSLFRPLSTSVLLNGTPDLHIWRFYPWPFPFLLCRLTVVLFPFFCFFPLFPSLPSSLVFHTREENLSPPKPPLRGCYLHLSLPGAFVPSCSSQSSWIFYRPLTPP